MIEQGVVENIIETAGVHIVDIISDFVTLKRRGANYVGCCPFHNEKTGSFTVSPSKGFYKCFGCGKAGNAVKFIMEYEHLEFPEAIKYLGQKLGIEVKEEEQSAEQKQLRSERESMMAVSEFARRKFISYLWDTDEGQSVGLPYFRVERSFRDDIIRKFDLGYSPAKRDTLTNEALAEGFKLEFLQKTGITIVGENNYKADRFFGRVIFPIHNVSGKVVAFGGRVMVKSDKTAKYVNSPGSEIYNKSDIVYGIYFAKNEIIKRNRCYLVEGYADVVSMHQSGIENVVASSGTSLTVNQIRLIQRFTNNITVLYDGDAAGIKAAVRGIDMILEQGMNVKVLLLPDGEDPDSFARSHSADDFINYIESHQTDFIKFKTQLFANDIGDDPIKKSDLINQIVATIALVQDIALRTVYVSECSKLLNVEEHRLFDILEQKLVKDSMKKIDEQHKKENQQKHLEAHNLAEQSLDATPQQQLHQPTNVNTNIDYEKYSKTRQNPFYAEERQILYYFIKYIDNKLFVGTKDEITVGQYITNALAEDDIKSTDELFNAVIQLYIGDADKDKFTAKKFINSTNLDISTLAASIFEMTYTQSEIFEKAVPEEKQLDELVKRTIYGLKFKITVNKIEQLAIELKEAEANNDDEAIMRILNDIAVWSKVKKKMGDAIGGRTILSI